MINYKSPKEDLNWPTIIISALLFAVVAIGWFMVGSAV